MIHRLIILLLIVGCGIEPEDEIKDVTWLIADDKVYQTSNNYPNIIDTV